MTVVSATPPRRLVPGAALGLALASVLLAAQAQAAGSGMPWEEPLQQVLE